MRTLTATAVFVFLGCTDSEGQKARPAVRTPDSTRAVAKAPVAARDSAFPLVATPDTVRGLYVNRWAAIGKRMWALIEVAKTTEVNALVIDVKDDRGFMLYPSKVALARQIGADHDSVRPMRHTRLRAVLDTMRAYGIYPIARIVVVKDPLLANRKVDWSIRSRADTAKPWLDKNGYPWLDAHQPGVWQYAVDLAKEAVALGFSEVQFDYVRFPDEKNMTKMATYPLSKGRFRAQVIREQLAFSRKQLKPLGVPFTGDVFGLTATDSTDMGIGQKWELFVDQMDVVLPMAYPSHYAPGTYKLGNPNANPYAVIANTLRDAKRRSAGVPGAARIVPWYQDFTLGRPRYGVDQVRAQMKAGYDNGVPGWILWNPRSDYTLGALRRDSATGARAGTAAAPSATSLVPTDSQTSRPTAPRSPNPDRSRS